MTTFDELVGTRWTGTGELWLDPEGNEAKRCECTIAVPAGDGPPWGWRTKLSLRAMGGEGLVLQMTNIAPWGESGRAVRMVATRD